LPSDSAAFFERRLTSTLVTDHRYEPTALEILKSRDDAVFDPADPHTITIAGTDVQFQDVVAVTDADVEDLEPKALLYVTAHAHAPEAATLVRTPVSSWEPQPRGVRIFRSGLDWSV
jgi:hypothetical protein